MVFDWNGTILADTSACLRATNTVLHMLGLPRITRAHLQKHYTMPIANLYHAIGVPPDILLAREHEVHPLWHATYNAAAIRLRRGAKPMLEALSASYESVILSNYVIDKIDSQAKRLGVRDHFERIIAFEVGDATFRKRGKGARLRDYLATRSFAKGVIIGDSEEEVEIGRDLGLTTIAILDGMCSAARLRAQKPNYIVSNLNDIPKIVQRVFGGTGGAL